ncbi:MAG: hypothetical protein ACXQTJ_06755, partial [Candidatus Syntropharchaeales archaeon]
WYNKDGECQMWDGDKHDDIDFEASQQSQDPKASEGLSEKLERLKCDLVINYEGIWIASSEYGDPVEGATPLEAVQALEEQLKEGE